MHANRDLELAGYQHTVCAILATYSVCNYTPCKLV